MPAVRIREISPRLAFQAHPVATEQKVEFVDRLTAAGVQAIELSSFVHPKMVPGLADAEEVFARVKRPEGVSLECCVANVTGPSPRNRCRRPRGVLFARGRRSLLDGEHRALHR